MLFFQQTILFRVYYYVGENRYHQRVYSSIIIHSVKLFYFTLFINNDEDRFIKRIRECRTERVESEKICLFNQYLILKQCRVISTFELEQHNVD